MSEFQSIVTGIGSLPYKDAQSALDLIFRYCPQAPFWPQLPKRDLREGMIAQFAQKLPDMQHGDLEEFYEKIINKDVDYFKITEDYAAGLYAFKNLLTAQPVLLGKMDYIKGHITGPFTFAAGIKDKDGSTYLNSPVYLQAFIEGLAMKALWQIKFFREFSKKMIMFLDEPFLGCFGSAYTPINREDVVRGLGEITALIKSEDVLIGVHCCGNTDWSIFTEVGGIDIINFDAFGFCDRFVLYADSLKAFLERGGIICWGIAPTQELSDKITPDFLVEKLFEGIEVLTKKGLGRNLLLNRMLLSPACGLGSLEAKDSERIFKLLSETSRKIKDIT